MLRLDAEKPAHFCDGMTRRDFLHAGAVAGTGISLTTLAQLEAEGAVRKDKDVNCIMIFMLGGPSQLDCWDMKPDAPVEIRGPYRPIDTNVSGIQISEIFPRMARHADKYALVRSVYHTGAAVHDIGHQMLQTGRLFQGGIEHPHPGAVMAKLRGPKGASPPHVILPTPMGPTGGNLPHGQSAGYIGKQFDPLVLNSDPSQKGFKVEDLLPPDYITAVRQDRRKALREAIDGSIKEFEASQNAKLLDSNFSQAYTLMSSKEARDAFDIQAEPEALRQKYGINKFGQSCLMARRMLERGVRFVTINMFETVFNEVTWDIHGSRPFTPIQAYKDIVGPWFDNGYSSLLEDLSQRGMLENTLVVCMGEFGRTPKVNPAGGRDHWPACWTIFFAGGGVKGGQVVGASDEIGGYPKDRPVTPGEVAATVYHSLGVDVHHELAGPQGRPIPLVDFGIEPIRELF